MKTSIPMCFNNSEDPATYILLNKVKKKKSIK